MQGVNNSAGKGRLCVDDFKQIINGKNGMSCSWNDVFLCKLTLKNRFVRPCSGFLSWE